MGLSKNWIPKIILAYLEPPPPYWYLPHLLDLSSATMHSRNSNQHLVKRHKSEAFCLIGTSWHTEFEMKANNNIGQGTKNIQVEPAEFAYFAALSRKSLETTWMHP